MRSTRTVGTKIMKKYFIVLFMGFVLAQVSEYSAAYCVDLMQKKCYPLWEQHEPNAYQACMDNQKTLDVTSRILGFNFMYEGRRIIGY